ncbi:ER protein translocation subcomplex subunit Sec62 [Schizosaccharomyces cryophilus OY26]|uniref:Translocation protein SEC62 n=1 Tax=Schizosaccharomyces cryophilus (strain OY26 / ATCC MYA-4695 / CBS 11777 / NBRC 106824 / NRRL Y48691) TaxID=653667 RepID=S9X6R6_SCHCR|nr:ER protein translocation subcomplex subunit Sec62 [Schizosaccharomyces cryophilus OY26]EPY52782.1 ER protein translocation subcomplex subunit Sec62 [Schizosaccharomyces cryophilus OY26]
MSTPTIPAQNDQETRAFAMQFTNYLKSRPELKTKPAILNGKRVYYFRIKRVMRFLTSDAYPPKKVKGFPPISTREDAIDVLKLLIMNSMMVRVDKLPPKQKRQEIVELQVNRTQDFQDDMHYVWLYEPLQKRVIALAVLFALLVLALVLFPLWPMSMRRGAWYLSMAGLGVIVLFFALVVFRFILYCITAIVASPGLWLFPNLLADVGFCDSFQPVWAWHNAKPDTKSKKGKKSPKKSSTSVSSMEKEPSTATTTAAEPRSKNTSSKVSPRNPTIEEVLEFHEKLDFEECLLAPN